VAAGAAAAEVAAVAAAVEVAAVAGSLAAEVAAAAGAVASGSVPAWLAWLARVARAAADPGERAACAKSHEKRRCGGRRITSSLPQRSDKLGVGRHFAKVPRDDIAVLVRYERGCQFRWPRKPKWTGLIFCLIVFGCPRVVGRERLGKLRGSQIGEIGACLHSV
jgi:hypothetical protein